MPGQTGVSLSASDPAHPLGKTHHEKVGAGSRKRRPRGTTSFRARCNALQSRLSSASIFSRKGSAIAWAGVRLQNVPSYGLIPFPLQAKWSRHVRGRCHRRMRFQKPYADPTSWAQQVYEKELSKNDSWGLRRPRPRSYRSLCPFWPRLVFLALQLRRAFIQKFHRVTSMIASKMATYRLS